MAGVPETNNRTEQAIGKSRVRFKTVRWFKSLSGVLARAALSQWLCGGAVQRSLAKLAV